MNQTEQQTARRKQIAVIATGGTIAGQGKPGEAASYQAGEIPVSSIIESIPQVEDLAELTLHTVCQMDSNDITVRELDEIRNLCRKLEADENVDGIVITHGTDTFEESSFLLNMILDGKKPVIMTGAMRPATAASADGPMNLYQAIALACDERVSGMGVLAVFNDTIYSGSDLKKTDGLKTDAFKYNEFGTIGFMRDGQAFLVHDPKMGRALHGRFADVDLMDLPKVEILYIHQESDPELLRWSLDHYDGIVLAGTGSGNYPKAIEEIIEADEGPCKIVRSSRLLHGIVFDSPVFDPKKRTIPSYRLSPHKARILLGLAMSQTRDDQALHDIFRLY